MGTFFAKNKKWIIIVAIVLVVAIAAYVAFSMISANKEDNEKRTSDKLRLVEYVTVEELGFNTMGYVEWDLDYVALAEKLDLDNLDDIRRLRSIQEENEYNMDYIFYSLSEFTYDYELELEDLQDLFNSFYIYLDNNDCLTNGSIVTVNIEVYREAKYGKKLRAGKIEHEMTSLQDLVYYFPDFECNFVGLSGKGKLEGKITSEYEYWHDYITFYCDNDGYLTNGDDIEVTATISYDYYYVQEEMQEEGYDIPESVTITCTVAGLAEPLTADTCTDDVIEQAIQAVVEDTVLADPTLVAQASMVYFVEDDDECHIVVALEFPDEAEGKVWNHIRYLGDVRLTSDGTLEYDGIWHVLSGNGFDAEAQEQYILEYSDFSYATLIKLR